MSVTYVSAELIFHNSSSRDVIIIATQKLASYRCIIFLFVPTELKLHIIGPIE